MVIFLGGGIIGGSGGSKGFFLVLGGFSGSWWFLVVLGGS